MRALVVSGGGSRGQYAVGVCRYLADQRQLNFDIFSGVSVGALVASCLAQFPAGAEDQAYIALRDAFDGLSDSSIWRHWSPFGPLTGLKKSSFYNSAPIEQRVRQMLSAERVRTSSKKLRVVAVSLNSGRAKVFDEAYPDISGAVLASAAFPVFFKPVLLDNQLWVDGGVREVTPLSAALKAGATEAVVVTLQPSRPKPDTDRAPNALEVARRAIDLMMDEIVLNDIKIAEMHNRLVVAGSSTKRLVKIVHIRPSAELNADSLHFDQAEAYRLRDQGFHDAKRIFEA